MTPAISPSPLTSNPRAILVRRLSYLMLLRVILFTLVLGGTVALYIFWGKPEELGGPYVSVLFVFIATIYVLNILYATLLRLTRHLAQLAGAQILIDLLTSAVLVHFTGSAESGFVLFFLLSPIAAAVVLSRRAALLTATAGAMLFTVTVLLGHRHLLPMLPGQTVLAISTAALGRSLLINGGAMFAVAALAGYLSDLLRSADRRVEQQQADIADLAALHEDVVRCLTSGLLTIDAKERLLTINDAAREMLGLEGEPIGSVLEEIAPELAALTQGSPETRREETHISRTGEATRYYGVSISALTDRQGRQIGRIVNFQDLTALRRMEQMIKRSEQLAALGRVAAGVAHELRNPLASISGSIELMSTEAALSTDTRKLMAIALREIERLDGLVNELLDYTRPKPEPLLRTIDLGRAIGTLVEDIGDLHAQDEPKPELKVRCADSGLWVQVDLDALRGVLWNLVRNAGEAGSPTVTVTTRSRGDAVELALRDQGAGIPSDELEHVFEPFYTTKSKGSGLGLATVHRTVQEHGGSIEVESAPGKGSCFTIVLPRVPAPTAPAPAETAGE